MVINFTKTVHYTGMQYWKLIKNNVTNKVNQIKEATTPVPPTESLNDPKTIKTIAKSILHKFTNDEPKNKQQIPPPLPIRNGRIWKVAPPHPANANSVEMICEDDAMGFVANICGFREAMEKEEKMRVNKAKLQIFGNLEIQPIYFEDGIILKILKMEMQSTYTDLKQQKCMSLIERSQELVIERDTIDRAIQRALTSGYLWQANNLQNRNIIDVSFHTISNAEITASKLLSEILEVRQHLKYFKQYYSRINQLNQRRIVLAKKIKLLTKIKGWQNDISTKFVNIDQAFYVQRNRQKMYTQLTQSQTNSQRMLITKSLLSLINKQNLKVKQLIQQTLKSWIDGQCKLQKKHIQKMLILLYFIRNENMYFRSGIKVDLNGLTKREKLVEELDQIAKWEEYRYLNDREVRDRVSGFIEELIEELGASAFVKKNQKDKNKVQIPSILF